MNKEYFDKIRENMKARKITGVDIARATEHHPAWVNLCLRGEYPSYKAFGLPNDIRDYLVSIKLLDPERVGLPTPRTLDREVRCPQCNNFWDKFFCVECGYCARLKE